MAGIYIHVPFCKTRCIYCDFFTQTKSNLREQYIKAVRGEIKLRSGYLEGEPVDTIYFGGGTPSQLTEKELANILFAIKDNFSINENPEITLEANPDDLDRQYLDHLLELSFNRLSMGIQSFDNAQLQLLNRRHSAEKASEIVELSKTAGFGNISIDLMYGLPNQTVQSWKNTLDIAIGLNIQHISSYHLIYEEGTKLYNLLSEGNIKTLDEEISLEMFSVLIDKLQKADFIHYEISNFGKKDYFSRHNTSYWKDVKYLGIGPSAHSYNKNNRCWNINSIPQYIEGINSSNPFIEEEILDMKSRYNDFILTRLRTMWGINRMDIEIVFGKKVLAYFEKNIHKHIQSGHILYENGTFKLNRKGIFLSDHIMSDLMLVD